MKLLCAILTNRIQRGL